MKKCLLCQKSMNEDGDGFISGCTMYLHFGWKSRYDDAPGLPPPGVVLTPAERLAICREVVAYLCDECYEKNYHLFEGYDIISTRPKRKLEFADGIPLEEKPCSGSESSSG